jgi:hypothetical protein
MSTQFNLDPADAAGMIHAPSLAGAARSTLERIVDGIAACADYAKAAALYEDLSRLSNAELKRRGLSRETLGRDVCAACDRTSRTR